MRVVRAQPGDSVAMSDIQVTRAADRSRYEVRVDGALAGFARYETNGAKVVFPHTEVDDAYAHRGVGTELVHQALEDVVAAGLRIVPACPFVADWIRSHPDFLEHVDPGSRDGLS